MSYVSINPGPELEPFIKCYWTLDLPPEEYPEKQTIVPDGCMEMIFHYGDHYFQYLDNKRKIQQPKCFVFGQITNTLEIEPSGITGIFSVRFHPNGFLPFTTIPLEEMHNRAVPLDEIFGKEALMLEKEILESKDTFKRIETIEKFLLEKLQTPDLSYRIAKDCVEILIQSSGQLRVDELSEQLQLNRRNLERKFSNAIGLSPKQLSKIIRLQTTLKMMDSQNFTNLTDLAYQNGYFDQAHFIKDFREFTGLSPKQFYASNLRMTTLFLGTE
jgi:AraC-like DNA-binding protein